MINRTGLWEESALECIVEIARKQQFLTGDDVMNLLDEKGIECYGDPRGLGNVMRMAAGKRVITKTETWVTSKRKSQHSSPRRIWISLLYIPEVTK